jgi:hypothetical protein
VLINTYDLATNDRSNAALLARSSLFARSLSNRAHVRIDTTRGTSRRLSAGGISLLDLWGGIMVAKFVCSEFRVSVISADFYSVTLRMTGEVRVPRAHERERDRF